MLREVLNPLTTDIHSSDMKLATQYETIRREEYELISRLLEILPRVENLSDEPLAQVRDALFHADNPFLAVFVGPFSCGKSSIINALLGTRNLLRVGPTPTTDRIRVLRWGENPDSVASGGEVDTVFHPSELLKKLSFVDTPGLESIFRDHEAVTQRFLHRSDTVFMVMLATQAMSAKNLEALQRLKSYGKNIIILVNQSDLLSEDERQSVQEYVQEQSQSKLGYKPEVWMVSAQIGLRATEGETRDENLWRESGLDKLERYLTKQLSDTARLRQKLQTPLQIAQNANQVAIQTVQTNQQVLDQYTSIADNLRIQMQTQERTQERFIQDARDAISERFGEIAQRGSEAISDQFRLSRAMAAFGRGILEILRLGNIMRPNGSTPMRMAFERRSAFEPLNKLPQHVDELSARLEGRDLQDFDDLAYYARQQADALPGTLKDKMIGTIRAPQTYDRAPLLNVRSELDQLEHDARIMETDTLDDVLRNTVVYLALYEVILILFGAVVIGVLVSQPDTITAGLLVFVLIMMLMGLMFVPLRGRMLENAYTRRMLDLQARYLAIVDKAAREQTAHSKKLREDIASPLLRLIDAQTQRQEEQLQQLQSIQQHMVKIESTLADMGQNRLLAGLRN